MTFSSQKRGGVTCSAGEHRLAKRQAGHARAVGVPSLPFLCVDFVLLVFSLFDFACEVLLSAIHPIDRERQGEHWGERAFGQLLTTALTPLTNPRRTHATYQETEERSTEAAYDPH